MTNMPPTPPDIIQAITAMRSHWHSMKSEIAVKKEEIAHNQGELADMKEELAKTERGIRALEDIFGPMSETETAKTSRRTGAGRVAVKDCPLTLARRQEIGEKISRSLRHRRGHARPGGAYPNGRTLAH